MVAVELDVREQLVRASGVGAVLGHLDDRERLAGVLRRAHRVVLLGVQSRLEPVETRVEKRVAQLLDDVEGLGQKRLGPLEVGGVDERVPEKDAEPRRLDPVAAALRIREALVEHLDRSVQVSEHRVRAAERVGELRMVDDVGAVGLERLLEVVGGRARIAAPERELSEPFERATARPRVRRFLERLGEELLRRVEIVEAHRELGLREEILLVGGPRLAGREELAAHAEVLAEQLQHLERGRPRPRLDARNVSRGAPRKRELALTQAGRFAGLLETNPDGMGVVNVR